MNYGMRWAWLWVGTALAAACGGKTVVEPTGAGSGGSGAASSSNMVSSSSGASGCMSHQDCDGGEVCLFGTGACVPSCGGGVCDPCAPGTICDGCATSSCPECADCLSACVPIAEGQCDENDPCDGPNQVCLWELGQCVLTCGANGSCPASDLVCEGCVTGSCCGCDDCVDVCVPI